MNTNTTPGSFYADVKAILAAQGFTWHTATKETHDSSIMEDLHGKHWYCWCGPEGRWDVESGPTRDTEAEAVADALEAYAAFMNGMREEIMSYAADDEPDSGDDEPWFMRVCREGGDTCRHHINPSITDPKGIVIDALEVARACVDKVDSNVAYADSEYDTPSVLTKLDNAREAIRMVNL